MNRKNDRLLEALMHLQAAEDHLTFMDAETVKLIRREKKKIEKEIWGFEA